MKKSLLLLLAPGSVLAHEGHGLPGAAHWHVSDAWGFVLVGAVALAALWWGRRK